MNYVAALIVLGVVEVYAGPEFLAGLGIGMYIGIEIMQRVARRWNNVP